jgi:hypothetical protein
MERINAINPCENIFDKTYSFGLWVDSRILHTQGITDNISFSGCGSDTGISDQIIQSFSKFIQNYGVTQIIDLSCGDMKWMSVVLEKNTQITYYHGNDVSLNALRMAQHNLKKRKGLSISFSNCNTSHKKFAKNLGKIITGTSLIISRMTFQHMTNQEIIHTIKNLIQYTKFTYIALTSIISLYNIRGEWIKQPSVNGHDINRGGYRGINMNEPPYDIAQPLEIMDDQIHAISRNMHRELHDMHYYNYQEFSKLKNIKSKFIKHDYVPYMVGCHLPSKPIKNKYKIYKIKYINRLLNKMENIESSSVKRIWLTLKN